VPYIENLTVLSEGDTWSNNAYKALVSWTANSDSTPLLQCYTTGGVISDRTCAITDVQHTGDNWTAEAIVQSAANYNFTLDVVLDSNVKNDTLAVQPISCVLGYVKIKTAKGPLPISSILEGDLIEQQDGSFLTVKRVLTDFITTETKMPDGRIFANNDSVAVTFWHKVLENGVWELPEDAGWREITNQMNLPLPIFHLELEKVGVLMSGNTVIESLHD
jgi:hypothetical protein